MSNETRVPIGSALDIVTARQLGRSMAKALGFDGAEVTLVAAAISEVSRNIVEYAKKGEIVLGPVKGHDNGQAGIQVIARDKGPGIPDIGLAMKDGYSTSRSLGLGLPGTRRLMDDFEVVSESGKGTTVIIRKWFR